MIEAWLQEWFATPVKEKDGSIRIRWANPQRDVDFFECGGLDSLGLVELIPAVEEAFPIKFHQSDYQDRRFRTIAGLAEIVNDRLRQG